MMKVFFFFLLSSLCTWFILLANNLVPVCYVSKIALLYITSFAQNIMKNAFTPRRTLKV